MEKLLTFNKNIGLPTFNLPAGLTCRPSRWCEKHCYAKKGNYTYPHVAKRYDANWEATEDLDSFIDKMIAEASESKYECIRIHSSGDFYSIDYLKAWTEIALHVPSMRFLCYTKRWRDGDYYGYLMEFNRLPNTHLYCSFEGMEGYLPSRLPPWTMRWAIVTDNSLLWDCRKQLEHITCAECRECFSEYNTIVHFKPH